MFNIGPLEFLVIAVLALVILGPERLPDAARQAGKVMGDLRRLSSGFQEEMKTAFDDADRSASVPVAPIAAPIEEGPEDPVGELADRDGVGPVAAVEAVSRQAPGARTTPKSTPASRRAATKKAVNGNPAKRAAPKKPTTAKKAPTTAKRAASPTKKAGTTKTTSTTSAAKAPAKKASPAKKAAGSRSTPGG